MEARDDLDNWSLLTPESVKSSAVCGDLVDPVTANLEESSCSPSIFLNANEKAGPRISLPMPLQKIIAEEINETDAADQLQISPTAEPSTAKVTFSVLSGRVECMCPITEP